MPKTPYSKYKHTREPALRRMLTQERLTALTKHLGLTQVQQKRAGDEAQYRQKQSEGQRALERVRRLVERRASPVAGDRKEAE